MAMPHVDEETTLLHRPYATKTVIQAGPSQLTEEEASSQSQPQEEDVIMDNTSFQLLAPPLASIFPAPPTPPRPSYATKTVATYPDPIYPDVSQDSQETVTTQEDSISTQPQETPSGGHWPYALKTVMQPVALTASQETSASQLDSSSYSQQAPVGAGPAPPYAMKTVMAMQFDPNTQEDEDMEDKEEEDDEDASSDVSEGENLRVTPKSFITRSAATKSLAGGLRGSNEQ